MTVPITLSNLANLQNQTTAVNTINANNTAISTAFSEAVYTGGDQMQGNLDMNSNHLLNLPAPTSSLEPVRLTDIQTLTAGGSITFNNLPTGGTTGQVLKKNSGSNYDAGWGAITGSGSYVLGTSPSISGATLTNPTLTGTLTGVRATLTGATTFYVNVNTGSDSNNGLTSGTPWKTIQHAVTTISNTYDLAGFNCTIQLADGTYPESVSLTSYVGRGQLGHSGPILIQGNVGSPGNVVVSAPANWCFLSTETGLYEWDLSGMTLVSPGIGVYADVGGWISLSNVVFGACTNAHMLASGGIVELSGNYTITGNSACHIQAQSHGQVLFGGAGALTCTLTGTPAFTTFAFANSLGIISAPAGTVTFSGSATGVRYNSTLNSVINTNSGGSTFFPGNSGGTTSTGGQYA